MAASDAADSAFEAHLVANWSATVLAGENDDDFEPDSTTPWVYFETESDEEEQVSVGAGDAANLHRESGVLRLYVIVPRGGGTERGRILRDQLAALFTRSNRDIGPVTCGLVRRTGGLAWEGEANGNWWALPLIVEWERDS